MINPGDTLNLLGKLAYGIYWNSSSLLCIYNEGSKEIVCTNLSSQKRLGGIERFSLEIILNAESELYVTIHGVPCKMTIISLIKEGVYVAEMIPSHTRKWIQSSDLVYLTDKTSEVQYGVGSGVVGCSVGWGVV